MIHINKKIKSVKLNTDDTVSVKEVIKVTDVKLPVDAPARMQTLKSEGNKWYLTVVLYPDTKQPFALFCHTNNKEDTTQTFDAINKLLLLARAKGILEEHIDKVVTKSINDTNISKLTRVISLLLRHGVLPKNVVSALDKVQDLNVGSFLFQIKKFLSGYIQDGEISDTDKCECGGVLVFSEGCLCCTSCGNSKCG